MKNLCFFFLFFFLLPSFNASAQIFINEVVASNASINTDPDFQGSSDWVELYNAGASAVNLGGYHLTDNISDTLKWAFPAGTMIAAKGYLLVWCDGQNTGLHTSYSLTKTGEEIGLYDIKKQLLDGFVFGAQETDVSYGRKTDGAAEFAFFTKATPGASNNSSTPYGGFTYHEPVFNHLGGFYANSVSLLIENLDKIGTLHYTLDGSTPTSASPIFTTALTIAQTTVVKAALIENGRVDGPVITNTYFINENFEQRKLPVVSLSTEPKYFWDPAIGLYTQTFKPLWEYPVHVEFYEPDGLLGFHHDAGIKVDGENSWELPQKMLSIFSRKKYGASKIAYQIFPNNPRKEYENIILRCSGNDWSNTLFRDGMEQSLSTTNNKNIDIQDFRPCIVFINGKYLGVHNLRSREDEEFVKLKYNVDPKLLDIIENDGAIKTGNDIAYKTMTSHLANGVQNDADFQKLATMMDVPNYTDYIQNELFCANTSWGHNISCYRPQQDSAKFRWFSFDFDRGFFMANVNGVAMDYFTTTTGASWSNPSWATLWLRQMLKNNNYKAQFISRFADHLYTTYHPTNINNRVDLFSNKIRAEMPTQIARWKGTTSNYGNAMPSVAYWENEVSLLKQYGTTRNAFLQKELSTYFNLSGDTNLDLDVTNRNHGSIKIHECNVPTYPWSGRYLNNVPIRLTAVPKTGFKFIRWEKNVPEIQNLVLNASKWAYYDEVVAAPNNWNSPSATLTWKEGNAEFGYGEGDEATVINFGSDANNKPITSYYRQYFDVTDITGITALTMRLKIDDGAVIYLNGNEVARFNMPTGTVAFSTLAASSISPENTWNDLALLPSALLKGTNLLAVEVHQYAANSSDVTFDAQLFASKGKAYTNAGTNPVLDFSLNNTATAYRAVFEPTGECVLPDTIFQNTTLTAACSPYKAQGTVVVKPNVTLTVEQGVEVQFPQQADMWVFGNIVLQGTQNQGITIAKTAEATQWGGIFLKNTTDTCRMNYVTIKNASSGLQRMLYPAAISGYHTILKMDHLTITETFDNPIFCRFSDVSLKNSVIHSTVTGDCINLKRSRGIIENCEFYGANAIDADGIDFDGVTDGVVRNCLLHDFRASNDDAIDIGEQCVNLLIEKNLIYDCVDKGISVGQRSSATIRDNTIAYCATGTALKDQSLVTLDHNTFFGTQKAISAYEKNVGYRGGEGTVTNCLAANSMSAGYKKDAFSLLSVSSSLSDTELPSGTGNLFSNPLFANPTWYDFTFQSGSPCEKAANDGKNLGSPYHLMNTIVPKVMLSEIYYNDNFNGEGEFLELYNPSDKTVDLMNFSLAEAVEFTFPAGAKIASKEYIVVAKNAKLYQNKGYQVFEWKKGQLANEGERIVFYDKDLIVNDFVTYGVNAPWADSTATYNRSLELIHPMLDNHFATSWKLSKLQGGTPGTITATENIEPSSLNELLAFPNPTNDLIHLMFKNALSSNDDLTLKLYTIQGNLLETQRVANLDKVFQLDLSEQASGMYFVQVLDKTKAVLGVVKVMRR